MVEISFTPDNLNLEVLGSHKLWALKSRLEVPLQNIKAVYADPKPAMGWFQGLKISGADIPNVFRAGLFYQEGNRVFWDVRHPKKTIVIELRGARYAKLIVEVKDPKVAVEQIRKAVETFRRERAAAEAELQDILRERLAASSDMSEEHSTQDVTGA